MSIILGILAALVLIVWGILRKKEPAKTETPALVKRYIHRGHSWMRETNDGDVLVGIDDFAQSLIGTIDSVQLPRLLKRVQQGKASWIVQHGNRVVPFVSPVTGRVIEKNEMVQRNPLLINSSPYGDGWLLRIRPSRLHTQLNNLITGKAAQQWMELAKNQLVRIFDATPALMYQDGGVIIKNLSDRASDDEWRRILSEFFLAEESKSNNHQ
ncbi:MAG: hypothetical protein HY961_17365 [Ignavibacteriae bacterium]|nr:hypothetical protein [Ignavibacteriota bacterium]